MTIKDCIDIVDSNKPNQYTITDKVRWLSFIDEKIINDVLKTHEGYDGRYDDFTGYSDDKLSVTLIAPSPYDRLYTQYLKMKIDEENGETARYNNSATLFNSYYLEYKKYYNKLHKPLSNSSSECNSNIKTNCKAVTDAELESLKNELSFILKNYFADTISDDKVNDVVTKYMQNNTELFKGKDGKTPVKGFDYFTPEEVKEFQKILDDNFNDLKESELGKKENLITPNNENIVEAINGIFSEVIQLGSFVPSALDGKVDKVEGKGLSEVNYTANDKTLLYRINNQIKALDQNMAYKVDAVPGKTLSSNDYTSEDKALLYETKTQMSGKVDKEFGKGLSTEDYTTNEKKSVEYLSSYFKTVPEGKTIDDLTIDKGYTEGVYLSNVKDENNIHIPQIISIHLGWYEHREMPGSYLGTTYQVRFSFTDYKEGYYIPQEYKIESRYYVPGHGWTEWEEVYVTKSELENIVSQKPGIIADSGGEVFNDYTSNVAGGRYTTAKGRGTIAASDVTYEVKNIAFNGYDAYVIIVNDNESLSKIKIGDVLSGEFEYDIDIGGFLESGGTKQFTAKVVSIDYEEVKLDRPVASSNLNPWIVKSSSVTGTRYRVQSVDGMYNVKDTDGKYLHITGNGENDANRSNAYTLDKDGVAWFKGGVKIGGNNENEGMDVCIDTRFTYAPQLEITAEEAVNTITINEIGGISLSDYNYTAIKCMVENAVLETAGPNSQVTVYVNSKAYDKYQVPMGSPTTFINANKKLYWGCYADIKSGLMLSASSSVSNETWTSTVYMPINSQNLHLKDKIEVVNISIVLGQTFPIGTKFKLWFK